MMNTGKHRQTIKKKKSRGYSKRKHKLRKRGTIRKTLAPRPIKKTTLA